MGASGGTHLDGREKVTSTKCTAPGCAWSSEGGWGYLHGQTGQLKSTLVVNGMTCHSQLALTSRWSLSVISAGAGGLPEVQG